MLEFALEKLDKYLENCKVETLVIAKGKQIYQSLEFGKHKSAIVALMTGLEVQFENARKEFKDKSFLERIAIEQQSTDTNKLISMLSGLMGSSSKPTTTPKNKNQTQTGNRPLVAQQIASNWECTFCTYYNQNNPNTNCIMCNRRRV